MGKTRKHVFHVFPTSQPMCDFYQLLKKQQQSPQQQQRVVVVVATSFTMVNVKPSSTLRKRLDSVFNQLINNEKEPLLCLKQLVLTQSTKNQQRKTTFRA